MNDEGRQVRVDYPLVLTADPNALLWLHAHPAEEEALATFVAMMVTELAANNDKGNRPGWLAMSRREAVAEVHWHAAKLAVAAKAADDSERVGEAELQQDQEAAVREYAADVANCALMVLDAAGLLNDEEAAG